MPKIQDCVAYFGARDSFNNLTIFYSLECPGSREIIEDYLPSLILQAEDNMGIILQPGGVDMKTAIFAKKISQIADPVKKTNAFLSLWNEVKYKSTKDVQAADANVCLIEIYKALQKEAIVIETPTMKMNGNVIPYLPSVEEVLGFLKSSRKVS